MIFSHASGWLVPFIVVTLALVFSGVSFRFGATCHINHKNSLADFWIPILLFAGLTVLIQFATLGYCIKVYLASLADTSASTEGSGLPTTYTGSMRTMTPRQAYRRVRRVIALQWKGIAIVLIIICDVIFFSVVFVFLDNTVEDVKHNPEIGQDWIACLVTAVANGGGKEDCLDEGRKLVVNEGTIFAVLFLLAVSIPRPTRPLSFPPSPTLSLSRKTANNTPPGQRPLPPLPPWPLDNGNRLGRPPPLRHRQAEPRVRLRRRALRRQE